MNHPAPETRTFMCDGGQHTRREAASLTEKGWVFPGTKRWCAKHERWECRRHAMEHNL